MQKPAPLAIAFREVRHFRPEDCLHSEAIHVRGELHDWSIPAHRHEGLHQFQLVLRGRVQAYGDQRPRSLQGPVAFMLPPGVVHGFDYERGCEGHQITVPSSLLVRALAEAPALASRLSLALVLEGDALGDDLPHLQGLFKQLNDEFEHGHVGRSEALQAQALLIVLWFLRKAGDLHTDDTTAALRDALVQRYRALLERHFRQHRPLGFYAESLQVTPDHLSRACRAVLGSSALDLLHERLLLESRRLLAYSGATVADIADELGFTDPAYFSRFFKRRTGCAPLAWRAAAQAGSASAEP